MDRYMRQVSRWSITRSACESLTELEWLGEGKRGKHHGEHKAAMIKEVLATF